MLIGKLHARHNLGSPGGYAAANIRRFWLPGLIVALLLALPTSMAIFSSSASAGPVAGVPGASGVGAKGGPPEVGATPLAPVKAGANLPAAPAVQCNPFGFGPATGLTVGTGPQWVEEADLNKDGKLDLIVVNFGSDNISTLLGNSTGGFGVATNFGVGTGPVSVAVGAFNRYGNLDLVVSNYTSNNVSIPPGTGTGSFGAAVNYAVGTNPQSVTVGDFNGDGNPDLVTSNYGINSVSVLLGNSTGGFGAATPFAVDSVAYSLAVGDFTTLKGNFGQGGSRPTGPTGP